MVAAAPAGDAACLSLVPAFAALTAEERAAIAPALHRRRARRGEALARREEPLAGLYVLAAGQAKLATSGRDGRELIFSLLGPGDFVGEMALFSDAACGADLVALGPCEVCFLHRDGLRAVLRSQPEIALRMLAAVSRRLAESQERLASDRLLSARQRVLRSLQALAGRSLPPCTLRLPFTHREWAQILGVTPETLARQLRRLNGEGLLEATGRDSIRVTRALPVDG